MADLDNEPVPKPANDDNGNGTKDDETIVNNTEKVNDDDDDVIVDTDHRILLSVGRPAKVVQELDRNAGVLSSLYSQVINGESANSRTTVDISLLRVDVKPSDRPKSPQLDASAVSAHMASVVYVDARSIAECLEKNLEALGQLATAVRQKIHEHFCIKRRGDSPNDSVSRNFISSLFTLEELSYKLTMRTRDNKTVAFKSKALHRVLTTMADVQYLSSERKYYMILDVKAVRAESADFWRKSYASRAMAVIQNYQVNVRDKIQQGDDTIVLMKLYPFEYLIEREKPIFVRKQDNVSDDDDDGDETTTAVASGSMQSFSPDGSDKRHVHFAKSTKNAGAVTSTKLPYGTGKLAIHLRDQLARRERNRVLTEVAVESTIPIDVQEYVNRGSNVRLTTICVDKTPLGSEQAGECLPASSSARTSVELRLHAAAADVARFINDAMRHHVFIVRDHGYVFLCSRLPFVYRLGDDDGEETT